MPPVSPTVSIVIPTKDRAALLRQTLESVRAQTFAAWEALVVDDHSADETPQMVRDLTAVDPRVRLIPLADGRAGGPAARNDGIGQSRGEFVIFLDSDDLLAPHCLQQRVDVMRRAPELDFAVFPCRLFLETPGDLALLWNADTGGDDLDRFLDIDVPWQTTSPIWRRSALDRVGPWDERARTAQDWEFHIRALVRGLKYDRIGRPDCYWRRPSAERDTIGKSSAMEPDYIRSRLEVAEHVLAVLRDGGAMTPRRQRILAGLYFRVAERLAQRATRRMARDAWRSARDLGLLTRLQYLQGQAFFYLFRLERLRPMFRRALERMWPAELIVRPETLFHRAPLRDGDDGVDATAGAAVEPARPAHAADRSSAARPSQVGVAPAVPGVAS
jgi:glycosyltransferase involved in cell wall biosynthesis